VTQRRVAVRLKVPDTTAYTALVALRRLGVPVVRVERATLIAVPAGDDDAALERVRRDESLFNPNLHEIEVVRLGAPDAGEIWVRADGASSMQAWRLTDERGLPVAPQVLERARDALLCNPAIETAVVGS
jgi:phosphoribosylformylglycinamidine (FGAM) synthase PurS component